MKKALKITSIIILIIAALLFAASVVLPAATTDNKLDAAFLILVQLNSIVLAGAGIGIALMFAKNDTAKKIGNGLTIASFVTGLLCAVSIMAEYGEMADDATNDVEVSIGAILMIVAVVFLVIHYAFLVAYYVINKSSAGIATPSDDVRIVRVREWKKLLEEGIINQEEFEEKRVQILGIKPKDDNK